MPDKRQGPQIAVEDTQDYKRAMEIFDNYYKYNDANPAKGQKREDKISELRGRLDEVYKGVGAPQIKVHTNKEEHEDHMGHSPYYSWPDNAVEIPLWSIEEAMNKSFIHAGLDPEENKGVIGMLVQEHGAKSAYDDMLAEFGHAAQYEGLDDMERLTLYNKYPEGTDEKYGGQGTQEYEAHVDIEESIKKYLEF